MEGNIIIDNIKIIKQEIHHIVLIKKRMCDGKKHYEQASRKN